MKFKNVIESNEKPTMCQWAVATVSSSIPISDLRKLA